MKQFSFHLFNPFHSVYLPPASENILMLQGEKFHHIKSFFSLRENEEICHLDAAQTSTSLVAVYVQASFFVTRLYDCHIFDRKKDIYFLLHLLVIFSLSLLSNQEKSDSFLRHFSLPFTFSSFCAFISFESFISFYSISPSAFLSV